MREKLCRDTNHMVEKEWAGKRASLLRSFTSFLTCYVEFTFFYELRRIPPDKFFIMPSRPAKPSGEFLLSKYELKCPKFVSRVVSFESRAKFERWLRAAGCMNSRRDGGGGRGRVPASHLGKSPVKTCIHRVGRTKWATLSRQFVPSYLMCKRCSQQSRTQCSNDRPLKGIDYHCI